MEILIPNAYKIERIYVWTLKATQLPSKDNHKLPRNKHFNETN